MQRHPRNPLSRRLLGVALICIGSAVDGSSQTPGAPGPSASAARPSEVWITASRATRVCFSPPPPGWDDNCFRTARLPRSRALPAGRYTVEFKRISARQIELRTEVLNACESGRCAFHYDWNSHTLQSR